jgi:hypothetical protein
VRKRTLIPLMKWRGIPILSFFEKLQIKGKAIVINFFYLLSSMKFPKTLGKKNHLNYLISFLYELPNIVYINVEPK